MVKVNFFTETLIYYMKEILLIIKEKEMENIFGKMIIIILENLKMD